MKNKKYTNTENGELQEIVIYQTDDGAVQIDVLMGNETVWLSTSQMTMLFEREESNIRRHIINIFKEVLMPNKPATNPPTILPTIPMMMFHHHS